jgi:hypothetical protein
VYPIGPVVNLNCLVVFATIGVPCGGPGAAPDCLTGKAEWSA